jgi:hypothetical protein
MRSKIKGDLDTKYKNINTKQRNPQFTRHKRSNKRWSRYKIQEDKHKQRNPQSTRHKRTKIKSDLDTKYKKINTNIGNHSQQDTIDQK